MMAEIVSLKNYRKAKRRAEKNKKAAQNRTLFGYEKAEQRRKEYEQAGIKSHIDGEKIDDDPKVNQ